MAPGALPPLTGDLVARVIVPAIAESLALHGWLPRSLPARALGCRIHHGRLYLDAEALRDPLLRLLDDSAAADAAPPFWARVPRLGLRLTRSLLRLEPRPGGILVAPCADAAWTPLFAVAGAVVVETGGLLSPASIIARELGIPSVSGVPRATSELREGEEVEVDGTNGTVGRVGDAKAASGEAA